MTTACDLLQQGIESLKAGRKVQVRRLLTIGTQGWSGRSMQTAMYAPVLPYTSHAGYSEMWTRSLPQRLS